MRRKKDFTKGVGTYYFNVGSSGGSITISRNNKAEASFAFKNYKKQNKDCEWLGKWNGKDFDDSKSPEVTA